MQILQAYDYCLQKTVAVTGYLGGPYYSKLNFREGSRGKHINYRNRSEVCRHCTRKGTKNCPEVTCKERQARAQMVHSEPKEKEKGGTVVVFRSQRRV